MSENEKTTYGSLHLPNKYLKYLFEPRLSIKKDCRKITKYFPEKLDLGVELIVTNRLGYEPIRSPGKRRENLTKYLGEIDLRKKENSLNIWEYVTDKSSDILSISDYEGIINQKKDEIKKIKSELSNENDFFHKEVLTEKEFMRYRNGPKKRKRMLLASIFNF